MAQAHQNKPGSFASPSRINFEDELGEIVVKRQVLGSVKDSIQLSRASNTLMGAFTGGEAEVDLAPLVAEHKFVAFYFTTPGSTPCLVWDSVVK